MQPGQWDTGAIPDITPEEVRLVQVLRERLEREGHIADEHDMEYFTADRLLKYLRARDHHEGRAAVAGGDGCRGGGMAIAREGGLTGCSSTCGRTTTTRVGRL